MSTSSDLTQFNNYNLFLVVILLFLMCYCRIIGEFLLNNCIAWEEFLTHHCLQKCCGCDNVGFLQVVRGVLILYTFSLPVIFCVAHYYRNFQELGLLTVFLKPKTPFINACLLSNFQNRTNATNVWTYHLVTDEIFESWYVLCHTTFAQTIHDLSLTIDVIYLVLPYAFASSINCLIWVRLTKSQYLTDTSVWDENMDVQVAQYEISFVVECLFGNIAIIFLSGSGNTWMDLLMFAFLVSGFETFFILAAKTSEHTLFDTYLTFTVLILLFGITMSYMPLVSDWHDSHCVALQFVLMFRLTANILLHYAAHGQLNAGYMILFRLLNTMIVSLTIIVFLLTA